MSLGLVSRFPLFLSFWTARLPAWRCGSADENGEKLIKEEIAGRCVFDSCSRYESSRGSSGWRDVCWSRSKEADVSEEAAFIMTGFKL